MAADLLVGAYVISRDPNRLANRLFLGIALALSCWGFGEFIIRTASSPANAMWGGKIGSIGWCLVAPLFLHLAFVLVDAAPGAWRRGALYLSYSLGALFLALTWSTDFIFREFVVASGSTGYREVGGILRLPSKVFVVSVFLLGITVLAYYYSRATTSSDRKARIGLAIIAAAIPLVTGLVTDIILPLLGREAPFSSQASVPFMAAVTAYAVTRQT